MKAGGIDVDVTLRHGNTVRSKLGGGSLDDDLSRRPSANFAGAPARSNREELLADLVVARSCDLELRGRQQARRYTWRDTAKHTLLAYQRATEDTDEDEPQLRRSL